MVLMRNVVWRAAEREMKGLKHAERDWSQTGIGLGAAGAAALTWG